MKPNSPHPLVRRFLILLYSGAGILLQATAEPVSVADSAGAWHRLFDGKSLAGWRAAENPGTFTVRDECIVVRGPRAHLFYDGAVGGHDFIDFELRLEVRTFPQSNSGVYFHTRYQEAGWPDHGHEVQVNNSQSDPSRTAGLYDVKPNYEVVAKDGEWFTLTIRAEGRRVVTKVNNRVIVDWTEPADWRVPAGHVARRLARGTFALQGHDPASEVHYRNIRVRLLAGDQPAGAARDR